MSRVYTMQTAFNGGELSPFMLGRPDHAMWPVSCAEMVGWVPRPQGPAEACPGFEFAEEALGPSRLIAFEPYATQAYVIEASAGKFRFYTNDVLLKVGGNAVTVNTPYSFAELQDLDWEESTDVVYLFHPTEQTRILTRTGAAAFNLSTAFFENGPFLDRNGDEAHTLSFNGVTGPVTVTSSKPLFAPGDVGRLIEVEAHDLSNVPSWEPGITTAVGKLMQWDGRVYQVVGRGAANPPRTGTVAPVHTRGVEWDGLGSGQDLNEKAAGGVQLAFMHDMFGRLRITDYINATTVTATVTRRLPLQLATSYNVGDYNEGYWTPDGDYISTGSWTGPGSVTYTAGTWRWRLGAFSGTTGWPAHGVIKDQRLWLFLNDRFHASAVGDLLNFDRLNEFGEVSNDMAISYQLDEPDPVQWASADGELFFGTTKAEYVIRAASATQGIGPLNIEVKRQTRHGSAALRPIELGGTPIFLQRNGRKIMHMVDDSYGRYVPVDLTRYADHITASPLTAICWQKEPLQLIWTVREDGVLAVADYVPEESVLGWVRRPLARDLRARDICTITDPTGRREQLWCVAERGDGRWFVMLLAPWREAGATQQPYLMSDAGLTYSGDPINELYVPHLAGESVEVVANGQWLGTMTAEDGTGRIVLDEPAATAAVGLPFDAYFVLVPQEAGGDNGPAQAKMQRTGRMVLRVQESLGLSVECQGKHVTEIGNVYPGTDLTEAIPTITSDVPLDIIGAWTRASQLTVRRVAPLPSTVLGLMQLTEVSQR